MLDRLWEDPTLADLTLDEHRELATRIARDNLLHEIRALGESRLPVSCPSEAAEAARAAVALEAPVTVVLQCYRAGHVVLWSAWQSLIEELAVPPPQKRELLDAGIQFMFDYVDRCSAWVEREYGRERERSLRAEEQRRVQAVLALLEGRDPEEWSLSYGLAAEHLAIIAWGRRPLKAVELVRDLLLHRESLVVSVDRKTCWAWLGATQGGSGEDIERVRLCKPPAETAIAMGGPAHGVDGFRRSHRQAELAKRVASISSAPVTLYGAVALEALALSDNDAARIFVATELGSLAEEDDRSEDHRMTLRAYFATGHNAASAGRLLGVHERTVANRLRTIEGVLGHSVVERRSELEMALRLLELLRNRR
jgi:hypothetical protein